MSLFNNASNLFINGTSASFAYLNGKQIFSASTGSVTASISTPYEQLDTITSYLRNYVTELRNPQFFLYRLDGNQYQILDGGNDMFDQGNYTAPWLRTGVNYVIPGSAQMPIPPAITYASQSRTLTDINFGYNSFGYTQSAGTFPAAQSSIYHPLTVFGARSGSGPIGWQKSGNIGADGLGSILTGSLYTGSVINGFTTYAYFRQTYGQGADPNICDVYMLFGHPNWNSNFGTVIWSASMSTQGQGGALYATGSATNLLAVTTLLSRSGSTPTGASLPISASDIQAVVNNYTTRMKEALNY